MNAEDLKITVTLDGVPVLERALVLRRERDELLVALKALADEDEIAALHGGKPEIDEDSFLLAARAMEPPKGTT